MFRKDTNSWSGLQATTEPQLESLRQTVRALEALNAIDWATLLAVELPDYGEYVTEQRGIGKRPDFEADIRAAELSELIGTSTIVRRRYGENSWYLIVGETPKQFRVAKISAGKTSAGYLAYHGVTLGEVVEQAKGYTTTVYKEKFLGTLGKDIEKLFYGEIDDSEQKLAELGITEVVKIKPVEIKAADKPVEIKPVEIKPVELPRRLVDRVDDLIYVAILLRRELQEEERLTKVS
ncbi:MAG: hypothetical protein LBI44_03575 [Oscillospiraceae bacterium]|jgi:hypothetical protein|nr:hypothetical protein [Oscillospiraceae bacterium]